MKKYAIIVLALVIGLFTGSHLLRASESPYPDWFANWFNNDAAYVNSNNQLTNQKLAHGTYNFAVDGGGTIGTAIPIHVVLPAKAVVSRVYYFVTTALANSETDFNSTNFMSLGCGTGGGEFKALNTNKIGATSSAAFVDGIQTGTAATSIASSSTCVVGMNVQSHSLNAGKVDFYINYSVSQ